MTLFSSILWRDTFSSLLTYFNNVEKRLSFGLSVCPSVNALTIVNIFCLSSILHMLFLFDIAWTVWKMICIGLLYSSTHTHNIYRYITANREKIWKSIKVYLYYTKFNEINACHLYIYISMFSIKKGINNKNIFNAGSHKIYRNYCQWGKIFKRILIPLFCLKYI